MADWRATWGLSFDDPEPIRAWLRECDARDREVGWPVDFGLDAIDEIERLRDEVARLRLKCSEAAPA